VICIADQQAFYQTSYLLFFMKIAWACLYAGFLSFCMITIAYSQSAKENVRVMSYNVRYDNPGDGENRWSNRKERLTKLIAYHAPDLFGTQEVLLNQLQDIEKALPQYAWYGAGRDDGKQAGEFSAIFYHKDRFSLLDKGTFWLSTEPDKPTKGWDAAIVRVCSWVKLKDKATGKDFFMFNTHFDHIGVQAREQSAALIVKKIRELAGSSPVVLTGDFNTPETAPPYQTIINSTILKDTRYQSKTGHYGPEGSFSTFQVASKLGERIDYIFVNNQYEVLRHAILTDSQNGFYPSDHLPVIAEIRLKK
jgi:endonuclease/exonuclease/phosphatase family metal-dependent hydrolase